MNAKPFRNDGIDKGERITGEEVFCDASKQPGRRNEDDPSHREVQAENPFRRESSLQKGKVPLEASKAFAPKIGHGRVIGHAMTGASIKAEYPRYGRARSFHT